MSMPHSGRDNAVIFATPATFAQSVECFLVTRKGGRFHA